MSSPTPTRIIYSICDKDSGHCWHCSLLEHNTNHEKESVALDRFPNEDVRIERYQESQEQAQHER